MRVRLELFIKTKEHVHAALELVEVRSGPHARFGIDVSDSRKLISTFAEQRSDF